MVRGYIVVFCTVIHILPYCTPICNYLSKRFVANWPSAQVGISCGNQMNIFKHICLKCQNEG